MASDADRKVIEERGTNMLRDFTDRRLKAIQLAHFPVYHYTDDQGLEGIINGGLLRATDALKIPGAGEIVPALNLALDIASALTQSLGWSPEYLRALSTELNLWREGKLDFQTYVTCFCTDADDPHLWKVFGRDGTGYMLGFAPDLYIPRPPQQVYSYLRDRVRYADSDKRGWIDEVLRRGEQVLVHVEESVQHALQGDEMNLFASYVAAEIAQRVVVMKPDEDIFRKEKEYRFVYTQQGSKPFLVAGPANKPHVSLPLASPAGKGLPLPLTQIVLGKKAALSEDYVKQLLAKRGYDVRRVPVTRTSVDPDSH